MSPIVVVALFCAAAAAFLLWLSARNQARRESRRILKALQTSDALLAEEVEPLVEQGQLLLAQASTASAAAALLAAVSEYRARVVAAHSRLRSESEAQLKVLAEAGIDMGEAIDALGRANLAVQDLYALASRAGEGRATELLHASARSASARISELGQHVHQIQNPIHVKEAALERLTA